MLLFEPGSQLGINLSGHKSHPIGIRVDERIIVFGHIDLVLKSVDRQKIHDFRPVMDRDFLHRLLHPHRDIVSDDTNHLGGRITQLDHLHQFQISGAEGIERKRFSGGNIGRRIHLGEQRVELRVARIGLPPRIA